MGPSGLALIRTPLVVPVCGELLAVFRMAIVVSLAAFMAYSDGPPPGHTGGFGEPTCHSCHADNPVNDEAAKLFVDLPEWYESGCEYEVVVRVGRGGMQAGGFQLSARIAAGNRSGRQAGVLRARSDEVSMNVLNASGVQYAAHVSARDNVSEFRKQWSMTWTAPDSDVPVVFHVVANASNGDDSEFGDYIVTDSLVIGPADSKGPRSKEVECDRGGEG